MAKKSSQTNEETATGFAGIGKVAESVDLFQYADYRLYLRDIFSAMKASKKHFSYRFFARMAGFGSESFFRMVMRGERNLSPASAVKFARALKLPDKNTVYFETLVLYNQAEKQEDRDRYFQQLVKLKPHGQIKGLTQDQFEYLTQGLFVVLREMTALPGFKADPEWICQNLRRPASPGEVRHALEVLERLQLLKRDSQGRLKHSGRTLQAPESLPALEMLNFYRQILFLTRDVLLSAPYEDWDFASLTLPIPKKTLPKLMEIWRQSLEDMVHVINEGSRDFSEVYQINLQIFPATSVGQPKAK